MNKKSNKGIWKSFFKFYTNFKIPWWLFIAVVVLGIVASELTVRIAKYTVAVNKGELYNAVILGYVLLYLANTLVICIVNVLTAYGTGIVSLRARDVVWRKILGLKMSDIEKESPSGLITAVSTDVQEASESIRALFSVVTSTYTAVRAALIMYQNNHTLSLVLLIMIPVIVFVFFAIGRIQFTGYKKIYASINEMTSFFSEHVSSMKHVKVQSLEEQEIKAGYEAIEARYKADIWFAFMSALQVFIYAMSNNIEKVIVAVGGSRLINAGKLESTGINTFSTYSVTVDQYIAEDLSHYQTFKGTQGALKHVNEILAYESEQVDSGNEVDTKELSDLRFNDVHFGFNEDYEVLKGVSFTIPKGSICAVIGDNGSGKSTVIKLLQGFYRPGSGSVMAGNVNLNEVALSSWRKQFGYVIQGAPLFEGTIRDSITYGCTEAPTDEELIEVCKRANCHEFIMELPDGYDTSVREAGGNLSGGQRQRIALARALMVKPAYLILDEATASLDYEIGRQIFDQIIQSKTDEQTLIMISHNMEEIERSDYLISIKDGKILSCGAGESVRNNDPVYKMYCNKQLGGMAE